MEITLNGQSQKLDSSRNLADIIAEFARQSNRVVAEVNGSIIPTEQWPRHEIRDGDQVELVSFVGGG